MGAHGSLTMKPTKLFGSTPGAQDICGCVFFEPLPQIEMTTLDSISTKSPSSPKTPRTHYEFYIPVLSKRPVQNFLIISAKDIILYIYIYNLCMLKNLT